MITEMFTPMTIGNCEIKNRLVVPAMVVQANNTDGTLNDRFIKYHEEKAKGGWGLIITEDYGVSQDAKGYTNIATLDDDSKIAANKAFTDLIHSYGTKIFCQIYHAGKQKMPNVPGQAVAPSAIKDPLAMNMPRELTVDEIKQIVKDFGSTARRAKEAGFDGVEVHAAHGYLIAQFLSFFINKRTDEYGGCFANRLRFLDEVYSEVRKEVGEDFPVIVRMSLNEYVTGGRTEAESLALARHLDELGFDAIHVSNGAYASDGEHHVISNMFADNAFNRNGSQEIKSMVSCPVILANKVNDPDIADTMLKLGKADFIAMGRESLADPYYPTKVDEGRFDEINYCIGCLQGCEEGVITAGHATCLVNPRCCREVENEKTMAEVAKKVMVIGAGPAGLIAARTAAERGHHVTIFEASEHIGGAFRSAAYPMGKGILSTVASSYRAQCEKLGVEIELGTPVDENLIKEFNADSIIVATGSKNMLPPIEGINGPNVVSAEDVLLGNVDVNPGPVVVCGGGEVGSETAEFIAQTNYDVSIVEMKPAILTDMFVVNMLSLARRMKERGIKEYTNATVKKITEDSVVYTNSSGEETVIPAATVVAAFGYKAYNPLEDIAKTYCSDVKVVGSAVKAGNALVAIKEGYQAALEI